MKRELTQVLRPSGVGPELIPVIDLRGIMFESPPIPLDAKAQWFKWGFWMQDNSAPSIARRMKINLN